MKEIVANFWDVYKDYDVACITTNGAFKKIGDKHYGVMGAGIAKQMSTRFPTAENKLGEHLVKNGNTIMVFGKVENTTIISFPVKDYWYNDARIDIIVESCNELVKRLGDRKMSVLLPRPGSKNGNLKWDTEVKPFIAELLDDRFTIITNDENF